MTTARRCWSCSREWGDGAEHYDCMEAIGKAWGFMEEAALLAIDERRSLQKAQSYFDMAKDDVNKLHRRAYQT